MNGSFVANQLELISKSGLIIFKLRLSLKTLNNKLPMVSTQKGLYDYV